LASGKPLYLLGAAPDDADRTASRPHSQSGQLTPQSLRLDSRIHNTLVADPVLARSSFESAASAGTSAAPVRPAAARPCPSEAQRLSRPDNPLTRMSLRSQSSPTAWVPVGLGGGRCSRTAIWILVGAAASVALATGPHAVAADLVKPVTASALDEPRQQRCTSKEIGTREASCALLAPISKGDATPRGPAVTGRPAPGCRELSDSRLTRRRIDRRADR
jgi:hypothetical protein